MDKSKPLKGRGAQGFSSNRFEENRRVLMPELGEYQLDSKTKYIEVFPKSLINKVDSPDVPYDYSINPYQGCEHGCIYYYARNSHEYWGYDPGLEFEAIHRVWRYRRADVGALLPRLPNSDKGRVWSQSPAPPWP